jgi:hypothetical protein
MSEIKDILKKSHYQTFEMLDSEKSNIIIDSYYLRYENIKEKLISLCKDNRIRVWEVGRRA